MNISPYFKLGYNVKEMTSFSTTRDAVIFPKKMLLVVENESLAGETAISLIDTLEEALFYLDETDKLFITDINNKESIINKNQFENSYLIPKEDGADILVDDKLIEDVLKISKIQN